MRKDSPSRSPQRNMLADFFTGSPLRGSGLKIERSKETAKPLDFENASAAPS